MGCLQYPQAMCSMISHISNGRCSTRAQHELDTDTENCTVPDTAQRVARHKWVSTGHSTARSTVQMGQYGTQHRAQDARDHGPRPRLLGLHTLGQYRASQSARVGGYLVRYGYAHDRKHSLVPEYPASVPDCVADA
eukprot:2603912-Rhodomonas_salina.2